VSTCERCGRASGPGIEEVRRITFRFLQNCKVIDLCRACGDPANPGRHDELMAWARAYRPKAGRMTAGQELQALERRAAARAVVEPGPMADTCQTPCKPPCERESVTEVEHKGKKLRICSGHNMRWRRAETPGEKELALTTPLRSGPAMVKTPAFRVPPELDERLRAAVAEDGLELNEVGREALELWLERRERRQK